MYIENVPLNEFSCAMSIYASVSGNEVAHLRESVHDNQYGIKACLCFGQLDNKVHANICPLVCWYLKRLQEACSSLSIALVLLTLVTRVHIFFSFLADAGPPEMSADSMVGLFCTHMSSNRDIMELVQNSVLDLLVIRDD